MNINFVSRGIKLLGHFLWRLVSNEEKNLKRTLLREGIRTEGTVVIVSKREVLRPSGNSSRLVRVNQITYEYEVDGRMRSSRQQGREYWMEGTFEGAKVTVLYAASDPLKSTLDPSVHGDPSY